ncbi:hypothetical protein MNBD_ALPHA02-652 [hydrothermal vent metagenome]|uniref:Cytochrome c-552/4 domain-containing protein n=1 Tax=hydrothermal vent metagenome TaxID=652676 RepID=A0A3B0RGQ4_9ZZZZ
MPRKFIILIGIIGLVLAFVALAINEPSSEVQTTSRLPATHWQQPLSPQGPPPEEWSELEQSLQPESCAECHADKYDEWKTSLHAHAMSPGFVGQIITYDTESANDCMECHAPLAEQKQAFADARTQGKGHLPAAQGLAAAGNSCAGCHIRENKRFGPPQRDTDQTGQSDTDNPHGGVFRTADFEKSDFCASCHQFPQDYAINGKPLENTVVEWQASPQAAEGISCQMCHMPDRKHLWRGIHDPDMVRGGLEASHDVTGEMARFTLKSTGVGHAFPTYITPKVVMQAVRLDVRGNPVPDTAVSYVIKREVGYAGGRWLEYSDTRILPGETASLDLNWGDSTRIKMWLEIYPDDYYEHEVYASLVESFEDGSPEKALIEQAVIKAQASGFTLFETILKKPE